MRPGAQLTFRTKVVEVTLTPATVTVWTPTLVTFWSAKAAMSVRGTPPQAMFTA